MPPGYVFCKIVFPVSRLLGATTFCAKVGQSLIIGAIRSFEYSFPSMVVGCTNKILPGSSSMMYPMQLLMNSDLPTWEAATITMRRTLGSTNASIGSLRYGVRLVFHGPGSAEDSEDRRRFFSAHSETVRSSGGRMPCMTLATTRFSRFSSCRRCSLFFTSSVIVIDSVQAFPLLSCPDSLCIFLRVVSVPGKLFHVGVHRLPDNLRSLRRGRTFVGVDSQPSGE